MTHDDAFLADVLATPLDDAPRLIYADFLEDAGDPDRAEFIRVQCELAQTPAVLRAGTAVTGRDGGFLGLLEHDLPNPRHEDLRRRERELLTATRATDWGPNRALWDAGFGLPIMTFWESCEAPPRGYAGTLFRRGFVESVTLSTDDFLGHAAALFAAAPVLEVTLAGQEPWRRLQDPEYWGWYAGNYSPTMLPLVLWERLGTFRGWTNYFHTREGALAALSAACVAFGRERAGLPPIPVEPAPARVA